MPLSRISWWVTVGVCLIAALLLLLNGYSGYSGRAARRRRAAAVNLRLASSLLGLEVDQHVGAAQARADRALRARG